MASSSRCGGSGSLLLLGSHMGAILLIKHLLIAVHDGLVVNLIRPMILIPFIRRLKPWIEGMRRELLPIRHGFRIQCPLSL
ncbi:hypothetical protein A2U01_0067849, partial [Trifolium medium]|nr:hypothetical protein [Trifolium medium]